MQLLTGGSRKFRIFSWGNSAKKRLKTAGLVQLIIGDMYNVYVTHLLHGYLTGMWWTSGKGCSHKCSMVIFLFIGRFLIIMFIFCCNSLFSMPGGGGGGLAFVVF